MIAILTDFGKFEGAGIMNGVILKTYPEARVVILSNEVSEFDIREGAWVLQSAYRYFPEKTVFLCVVDPGVGSARKAIAIETERYFFVGPDNGLMYPAASEDGIRKIVELPQEGACNTFHGRDVFAPYAAVIDAEKSISMFGDAMDNEALVKTGFYLKGREGEIVRIDNYGNIVTNLKHTGNSDYQVLAKSTDTKIPFLKSYAFGANRPFIVEGSAGTLEICVNMGSAEKQLGLKQGDRIIIR